jgi:type VI secretion system secreted protein VgrG
VLHRRSGTDAGGRRKTSGKTYIPSTSLSTKAGASISNNAGTNFTNEAGVTVTNQSAASETVHGGDMLILKGGLIKLN